MTENHRKNKLIPRNEKPAIINLDSTPIIVNNVVRPSSPTSKSNDIIKAESPVNEIIAFNNPLTTNNNNNNLRPESPNSKAQRELNESEARIRRELIETASRRRAPIVVKDKGISPQKEEKNFPSNEEKSSPKKEEKSSPQKESVQQEVNLIKTSSPKEIISSPKETISSQKEIKTSPKETIPSPKETIPLQKETISQQKEIKASPKETIPLQKETISPQQQVNLSPTGRQIQYSPSLDEREDSPPLIRNRVDTPTSIQLLSPISKPVVVTTTTPSPRQRPTTFISRTRNVVTPSPTYEPEKVVTLNYQNENENDDDEEIQYSKSPPISTRRRHFSPLNEIPVSPQFQPQTIPAQAVENNPPVLNSNIVTPPIATQPQIMVRPNYRAMSEEEQRYFLNEFEVKLNILRRNYPEYNFTSYPENASLDARHDIYAGYFKQVIINLNCQQYQIYLVIMFLALEAFGVKVLKLNMGGFAMLQCQAMNKYNSILIELGEKYYTGGPSGWPVEMRLIFMGLTSAITFIVVKWLANYIGGEQNSAALQNVLEQFLSGTFSPTTSLPANVPAPPTSMSSTINNPNNTSTSANVNTTTTNSTNVNNTAQTTPAAGGFDIGSLLGSFMGGGGGGGGTEMIAKLGSMFINATSKPASQAIQNRTDGPDSAPRPRPRFRVPTKKD